MSKGPQGEKRPTDVIGAAVKVMRIATGEEPEGLDAKPTSPAAELGKLGGTIRARTLTATQKTDIARLAAEARWKKG